MKCVNPFTKAGRIFPCGRCLPCRFRQRRIWFHRILLEASQHDYSSALTLTYDQSALPESGELRPEHLRDWLKRFRKRASERYPWRRLRFYACGEYGETSQRPHYHVILFGAPGCEHGRTARQWCGDCTCVTCSDVVDTWSVGVASIEALSRQSAAYVSGYVTRKLTQEVLPGRCSPFTRMSRNPGIGANAMWDVASTILQWNLENQPTPTALSGASNLPMIMGRYLRTKLHEKLGKTTNLEDETSQQIKDAVSAVLAYSWEHSCSPAQVLHQINEGYASQLAQREALKKGVL